MKIDLLEPTSEEVRLELVPLIDVIFCVLTFFILASVGFARQQAIDLDLPAAQTGQPLPGQTSPQRSDRLYVSLDAMGQIYLDQQPIPDELLYDILRQHQQIAPNGLIVLYASRDARYEDVVRVLDLLRAVGGDRVALATLPKDAEPTQLLDPQSPLLQPSPEDSDAFPSLDSPLSPLSPTPGDASPLGTPSQSGSPLSPGTPGTPSEPSPQNSEPLNNSD